MISVEHKDPLSVDLFSESHLVFPRLIKVDSASPDTFAPVEKSCALHYPLEIELIRHRSESALSSFLERLLDGNHSLRPLEMLRNGDARAFSGARLFRVFDEHEECCALLKAYSRLEEFEREVDGLAWIKEQHFTHFVIPEALDFRLIQVEDREYGVLLSAALPGQSIEELIVEAASGTGAAHYRKLERLNQAIEGVAGALAELHTRTMADAPRRDDYNARFFRNARNMLGCFRDIPRAVPYWRDEAGFIADAFAIIEGLPDTIVVPTAVHGDANTGNFLNTEAFTSLIDLTHLPFSLDEHGRGAGDPMRDVGNFFQKLVHSSVRAGFSLCDARELARHFANSYKLAGGVEIEERAFLAHRLRTGLGELFRGAERPGTEVADRVIEAYVELLQETVAEGFREDHGD